jgi:lysophospholipase L1-like esterase
MRMSLAILFHPILGVYFIRNVRFTVTNKDRNMNCICLRRCRIFHSSLVLALLLSTLQACAALDNTAAAALPVSISSSDSRIIWQGRFDTRDPNGPRCAWPVSSVVLRFKGNALNAVINEQGNDLYDVIMDNSKPTVLKLHGGVDTYMLCSGLKDGTHVVKLVKRTEVLVGTTQFEGFQLSADGELLPSLPAPKRRIEVIGDSISCGYGDEAANQNQHFSPETENANATYGALAARNLGAEYRCIAWSGRKMWPDFTIPDVYFKTLPNDPASVYDLKQWKPDAIVINLGTNDFSKSNPDETGWVNAYRDFIHKLRANAPQAVIYLAIGPMMSDQWGGDRKPLSSVRAYLQKIIEDEAKDGDHQLRYLEFAVQKAEDGLGADWHPSLKTHRIMADKLVQAIEQDLKWNSVAQAAK